MSSAFDSFYVSYRTQRDKYFESLVQAKDKTIGAVSPEAFEQFTRQQVNVLAQQLNGILQKPLGMTAKGSESLSTTSYGLVSRRINGRANGQAPAGTLLRSLLDATPETSVTKETADLYKVAQDNAILSSRQVMLNSVSSLRRGLASGSK